MNSLPVMDWNAKWDWENLVTFNSKTIESPKKQQTDLGIEGEGEIGTGSFNLSRGGGVCSGSEFACGSSARSSISASTDSSSKDVMKTSKITFGTFHASHGDLRETNEVAKAELAGTSPPLESSIGSGEPLIGLKLGKRTYFENNCTGGNTKDSSFSVTPLSSAACTVKKSKSSCQSMPLPCCQVEGCNLDLSSAKEYHRKHRVCESHSKCPKVVVGGLERRFCQQCSRFHSLSEFDEKKRSCRRRLSDHNARRRKPQHGSIQFNSARLSSPFMGGRQQIRFVLNNGPLVDTRSFSNTAWESTCSPKFTLTKGSVLKPEKIGGIEGQLKLPGIELPHAINTRGQNSNRLLSSKGTKAEAFTQGLKESMISFNLDAAPDLHRALSLLSTDSCGSGPANITLDNPIHVNLTGVPQPVTHGVPHLSSQVASWDYWQTEHSTSPTEHTTNSSCVPLNANESSHFQEIQLFKAPCENGLYSNLLN